MKVILPGSLLFCVLFGSCTGNASHKHSNVLAYVEFKTPDEAANKRSLFRLPSMATGETVLERRLMVELHACSTRISHYTDTSREPGIRDSAIYYVCRADIWSDSLPGWAPGFTAAKRVARALHRLYNRKVPEAYFDQFYICFSAKAEPDSLRLYVFNNAHGAKPPLYAQNDSNVNCKNIAVDPEQWYITTWFMMHNKNK